MGTCTRRQIGFMTGNPRASAVSFVVAVFADAAVTVQAYSDAARTNLVASKTINASGGASPKLAKWCNDRGSNDPSGQTWLCYVCPSELTGLSPGTRYYLKLTQGAIVESDASTCTAPAAGTDFTLWFAGCDKSFPNAQTPTTHNGPGGFYAIWEGAKDGGLHYLIFSDDLGYADTEVVSLTHLPSDSVTGKAYTGKAKATAKAYDYGMMYLSLLGMLGDTDNYIIRWGRDEYRNYCVRNMPWALQWGDHEFEDGIGQSNATAASAYATFTPGKTAWNGLFASLLPTPDIRSLDTTAQHWGLTLGDVKILNVDCVTRASGGTLSPLPYSFASILGNNQIDDILTAANTDEPFKLLVMPNIGERFWADSANPSSASSYYLSQQPLSEWQPTEWARLFFNEGQTPKSLMDNPKTNGTSGVLVKFQGDLHVPHAERHYAYKTGSTGTGLRADWTSFYFSNASGNNRVVSDESIALAAGRWHVGKEMLWCVPGLASFEGLDFYLYYNGCVKAEVRGSLPTKELRVSVLWVERGIDVTHVGRTEVFRVGSNRPVGRIHSDRAVF